MSKQYHNDLFDKGLEQVSNSANWGGGVMNMVLCAGVPANATNAATLWPTGNRVSTVVSMAGGDFTLQDRAGGGREVVVAQKAGATVAVAVPALHTGTADAGSTVSSLVDAEASFPAGGLEGKVVVTTGGTGAGQTRVIAAGNTGNAVVPTVDFSVAPDATTTYEIREDLNVVLYDGGTPRLLVVTDEDSDQVLTLNNPLTFPTFDIAFGDPA